MTAKTIAIVSGTIVLAAVLLVAGFASGASWSQDRGSLDASVAGSEEWMGPDMMMGPGWNDGSPGPAEDLLCAEICPIPGEAVGHP